MLASSRLAGVARRVTPARLQDLRTCTGPHGQGATNRQDSDRKERSNSISQLKIDWVLVDGALISVRGRLSVD